MAAVIARPDLQIPLCPLRTQEQDAIRAALHRYGSPAYVYLEERLREQAVQYGILIREAAEFTVTPVRICYAMLANHNPHIVAAVLHALAQEGIRPGLHCATLGELEVLRRTPSLPRGLGVIYADAALDESRLELFAEVVGKPNVEQLYLILQSQGQLVMFLKWFHRSASVHAIRDRLAVGLRVKLECHNYQTLYSAFRGPNARFGILPIRIAGCLSLLIAAGVRGVGFHLYPGTNVLDGEELLDTYRDFTELLLESLAPCRVAWKQQVCFLDFGGGFGIDYGRHEMLSLRSVGGHIRSTVSDWTEHDVVVGEILLEPGRSLIGPAGVLAATVVDVKEEPGRRFVVLNSGLSHFARPYIYQDQHQVCTLDISVEGIKPSFVVGSTMASGDFLAGHPVKNVTVDLPRVKPGDVLCILDAGAYGFCMSSNFSGLLKPAEILLNVKGGSSRLIRHHQTVAEMLAGVPL